MPYRKTAAVGFLTSLVLVLLTLPAWGADKEDDEETLRNAAAVLQAMLSDKSISSSLIAKADCIVVLPSVKKAAFLIGGSGGRGPMSCRVGKNFNGKWSAPAMYSIGGASYGMQVGGSSTDYVLLIMASTAVDRKMRRSVCSDVSKSSGSGT